MSTLPTQAGGVPVLVLKEGANRSRGRDAQHNNITAAKIVAESIKNAFGPKGMDKLLVDNFGDITVTSDGRTILDEMDIQHPAAKMLVEVAKTQDNEVGDGTTSAVIITGELLGHAESLIDKNIHPTVIIDGYKKASEKALETLEKIALHFDFSKSKDFLKKTAITTMASKLVADHKEYLSDIVIQAMLEVMEKQPDGTYKADIDDVKVEKKTGESLSDTKLVNGIVIDKEIVHSGMPKHVKNAKIILIDTSIENDKPEFDSKLNIDDPANIAAFLQEEEDMLRDMVDKIVATGANVVICQKGIDDIAQHFLAQKGIIAIRRAKKSDMEKLARAIGGKISSNINDLSTSNLGYAALVEERKIGDDKMTFIEGCTNPKAVTILIRGGTERLNNEAERSIHDALCVIRDLIVDPKVVAGGSASEMEMANSLKTYAQTISGREQLAILAFAEALESITVTLSENAGLDPIDILSELRYRHEKRETWAGIDVNSGKVQDMTKMNVYEPVAVKRQIIKSAYEAASLILKIDDVIASGKNKMPQAPPGGMPGGMGGGMGGYPGIGEY
ncbi:MAG: TCP-1/cpn60 chaperonin family protein [Candidatus Bathyarchaeota archaeon]|nr:TCP-1/cpn60 chaperonin family protein [Candidatus Termiticorpusculum sp.]MCL2867811.1 TCP-1/cpn60 chaperonin family protein [Candidatus Termiticorpusculum sp.]